MAAVAAGCGGASGLEDAKRSDKPYFYVGTSFDGLDLTGVDAGAPSVTSFMYGTCEAKSDMGCAPPLEVQNRICSNRRVIVVLYGSGDHPAKAAMALRPLTDAARKVRQPQISVDYAPRC